MFNICNCTKYVWRFVPQYLREKTSHETNALRNRNQVADQMSRNGSNGCTTQTRQGEICTEPEEKEVKPIKFILEPKYTHFPTHVIGTQTSIGVDNFFSHILSYFCFFVAAFNPCHGRLLTKTFESMSNTNKQPKICYTLKEFFSYILSLNRSNNKKLIGIGNKYQKLLFQRTKNSRNSCFNQTWRGKNMYLPLRKYKST